MKYTPRFRTKYPEDEEIVLVGKLKSVWEFFLKKKSSKHEWWTILLRSGNWSNIKTVNTQPTDAIRVQFSCFL